MDVDYNPGKSIEELPITDPIHAPCQDMAGMENPVPAKRQKSAYEVARLKERFGFKRRSKTQSNPLKFSCNESGCVEPWGFVNNANNQ